MVRSTQSIVQVLLETVDLVRTDRDGNPQRVLTRRSGTYKQTVGFVDVRYRIVRDEVDEPDGVGSVQLERWSERALERVAPPRQ